LLGAEHPGWAGAHAARQGGLGGGEENTGLHSGQAKAIQNEGRGSRGGYGFGEKRSRADVQS